MELSLFLKPAYVCGGLGVAATPAVGYGGWALYNDVINPTADRALTRRGFEKSEMTRGFEFSTNSLDRYDHGCSARFFPGVKSINVSNLITGDFSSHDPENFFKSNAINVHDYSSSEPLGCALLKLEHQDTNTFNFRSEVAIKRGKVGWILWDRFESQTSDHLKWEMAVIFLKQNSPDHWSVMGAFNQVIEFSESVNLSQIKISVNGENWTIPSTAPSAHSEKKYSGIWETTGAESDKEIFQELKVNYNDNKWSVLGSQMNSSPVNFDGFEVKEDQLYIYDLHLSQWGSYSSSKSKFSQSAEDIKTRIKGMLKSFHEPFKGKKGKWSDFTKSELCKGPHDERGLETEKLEKIKSFCYRQK